MLHRFVVNEVGDDAVILHQKKRDRVSSQWQTVETWDVSGEYEIGPGVEGLEA